MNWCPRRPSSLCWSIRPTPPLPSPRREICRMRCSLGLQLHILPASTPNEIDSAFDTLVELRAGALVVSTDPLFTNQRAQIVALAARHSVPTIYVWREFAAAGGLMSYGTDLADTNRQAGIFTV